MSLTPEFVTGGGGCRLAVYEGGNPAGPPIVFIHGFLGSHRYWQRQFDSPLAEEFRLLAFDLRGHGSSQVLPEAAAYSDAARWAEDLAAVLRHKALDRPVLVGFSYGPFLIADHLRAAGPDGIGGLVFSGGLPKLGSDEAMGMLGEDLRALFGELLSEDDGTRDAATRAFMPLLTAKPLDDSLLAPLTDGALQVPPAVRMGLFGRQFDNDDLLARLDLPLLVVQGEDDRIVLPHAADHIAATAPTAQCSTYPGVGHMPFLEHHERFNRELASFTRALR